MLILALFGLWFSLHLSGRLEDKLGAIANTLENRLQITELCWKSAFVCKTINFIHFKCSGNLPLWILTLFGKCVWSISFDLPQMGVHKIHLLTLEISFCFTWYVWCFNSDWNLVCSHFSMKYIESREMVSGN